ncbi:MAG: ABC transporter ATP-binding protein [Clostridia bacterium]|nr:ABC transporter ATP-binding protein [Clostridia bacterium]
MIEFRQVSKRFGQVHALRQVSFTAPDGCVLGLLGVNGAGKSTALNLMTGYYPPTEGEILIDGMDIQAKPRACKRRIGYLPEQPPLYDELTVREYLRFVSELREVSARDVRRHVENVVDLCGLKPVIDRRLGKLSKGYRQRAGIAQALCGDPPTLILDEPTVGLDPRQIVGIRDLIGELGKSHTIVFSTHLLHEVQQLCSRAIILHEGHIVWDGSLRDSESEAPMILHAVIQAADHGIVQAFYELECVLRVQTMPSADETLTECVLTCSRSTEERPQAQVFRLLAERNAPIISLTEEADSLETIFLRVTTGKEAEQ